MISRFSVAIRVVLLSILAALCVCGDARADGIMIPQVVVPDLPDMPSQRAIIKYRDGVETLIVESAFKGAGKEMAWILPVPSKPTEIAKAGTGLFTTLEMNLLPPLDNPYDFLGLSGEKYKDTLRFLGRDPFRFLAIAAFLLLIWSCLFFISKKCNHFILVPVFILLWFSIFVTSSLLAQRGPAPSPAPVSGVTASEIIPVGNYDVQVLEAVSPDVLSQWLNANEFRDIPEAGKPVVGDYIEKGWKFVVARLTRESDGLSKPHPLKLTFGTKTPVYPMRLTRLAGSDLYLDLFVIADQQATIAEMRANHVSIFKSEGDLTRYTTKLDGFSIRNQPSFFGSYDERLALPSLIDLMWDSCVMTRFKGVVPNKVMNKDFDIGFCNATPTHERYIPKAAIFAAAFLAASIILWIGTSVRSRKNSLRAKIFLTILFPLLALLEILLVHSIVSSLSIEIKMHEPDYSDVYLNILFHDPKHSDMEDVNVKSLEDAKRSYTLMITESKNPYTDQPFTSEEGPGEIVVTQEGESIMVTAYDKAGAPKKVRIKPPEDVGISVYISDMSVFISGKSRVHETALREIAAALNTAPDALHVVEKAAPLAGGIHIGLVGESTAAQKLIQSGAVSLHDIPPTSDAFEVLLRDNILYLLGNTPRGMLQAVYEFQEIAREGKPVPADLHRTGTFQIPQRFFHQRFNGWPGEPADIRYISHLGASHCLLTHDWCGDVRHLQAYVTSSIFPNAINPDSVRENHAKLRLMVETCLDYGIEPALWITELPCQGGPWVPEPQRQEFLTRFPADVLSDCGTYQGKVLCFGHPDVQAFYRDLLTQFFGQFPEISTLFLFSVDSGGEHCDPAACPRCKGMSKIAQRDRLIRFLLDEGRKVRPGLRVLTTGWGWSGDTAQFLAHQRDLPSDSGLFLAAETDGWQPERQLHDLLRDARQICRERGQTFIGYDDLHWGDDTVHDMNDIQDYPLGVGAKIRRWHTLGVDGVFDHWGAFNNDISCNSIACRAFFLNPLQDPETVCRDIAMRQFGEAAGPPALEAWKSLEQAHAILSYACSWAPTQWPGWYPGRECAPVPEEFAKAGIKGGEPPRMDGTVTYNPPELANRLQRVGDAWRAAYPHYQRAIESMREAEGKADDTPVFYGYWWSGEAKSPTRREHLHRQGVYLESMAAAGREIGLHFSLNAIYERVGGDADAYKAQTAASLAEDAAACREAADVFDRLKAQGDDRRAERDWAKLYRAKADRIDEYLRK